MFHLFLKKENPHSDTFLHLNEGSLHFYRLFFDWNNSIIALGVVAAVHMVADKLMYDNAAKCSVVEQLRDAQ